VNDDLYDGGFDEDDPETPMVLVWFRKVEEVSRTIVKTTIRRTTIVERNAAWSVSVVRSDLQGKLRDLVDSLKEDQQALFVEEGERIQTLSTLEQAHEELKGEHINDLEDGKKISSKKSEISSEITKRKADIET